MSHGPVAIVVGRRPPALSIGWGEEEHPGNSGFIVFMSECDLGVPERAWPEGEPVCLHCLIDGGDAQLARGLDLARVHGQVDWDAEAGEWVVPGDVWSTLPPLKDEP